MLSKIPYLPITAVLTICFYLLGCAGQTTVKLPPPMRLSHRNTGIQGKTNADLSPDSNTEGTPESSSRPEQRFTYTPGTGPSAVIGGLRSFEATIPGLKGGPFTLDIDNMPLTAFINEVYGNMLHVSYEIDKSLQNANDLVTLRIPEPQSAENLAHFVAKILAEYGVEIKKEQQYYRFTRSSNTPIKEPPLLISGRTLPEVPVSHRPIFQIVQLYHVRNINVTSALTQIYAGQDLKITDDIERNSVSLQGPRQLVASALETIKFLDQPAMRGRYSLRIDPLYQTPEALSEALVMVLQSEGYGASDKLPTGSILVLPLRKINAVLVFSADPNVLELVKKWVQNLDQPTTANNQSTLFYYPIKNTAAKDLAKTLSSLVPNIVVEQTSKDQQKPGNQAQAPQTSSAIPGPTSTGTISAGKSNLVVDEQRNAILYFGSSETWQQILPIIRQMDTQAKQVLIEVTIAEITLNETDKFGVEWLFNGQSGEYSFTGGTLPVHAAAGFTEGAFNYILNTGGQQRLVLKALATDERVNVLSTPRLMVKSGEEANIEIGNEIPILSSQGVPQGAPQTGGSTQFFQNIQYRKTGNILNIKPIVHSGRRIDIDISQESSEAQNNDSSSINSPSILNRKVETSLSLKDGDSVLLGGMIKTKTTFNTTGVPFLKDIPWLGTLFSTRSSGQDKTEIVVMIVPYIMDEDSDVEDISEAFRNQYSFEQGGKASTRKHQYFPNVYR